MKSDKFIWIPRGIILFFSVCATGIVVASLATNKWIVDPDFLDFEIYAFFFLDFLWCFLYFETICRYHIFYNKLGGFDLLISVYEIFLLLLLGRETL